MDEFSHRQIIFKNICFSKEPYVSGPDGTSWANFHGRRINLSRNLLKMTWINSKTIVFEEKHRLWRKITCPDLDYCLNLWLFWSGTSLLARFRDDSLWLVLRSSNNTWNIHIQMKQIQTYEPYTYKYKITHETKKHMKHTHTNTK